MTRLLLSFVSVAKRGGQLRVGDHCHFGQRAKHDDVVVRPRSLERRQAFSASAACIRNDYRAILLGFGALPID